MEPKNLSADLPRKLNLGCGFDKRPGYLNVDLNDWHDPDLVADVRNLDSLSSGWFTEIVAQDVLEHLERCDGPIALREWNRLLADDGQLVLRVPDLLGLATLMVDRPTIEDQRTLVQCLFGTQAYTGDFHLNGYTELLLRAELSDAGFEVASIEHFDEWLFDVVALKTDNPTRVILEVCSFMNPVWGGTSQTPNSDSQADGSLGSDLRAWLTHTARLALRGGRGAIRRVKARLRR